MPIASAPFSRKIATRQREGPPASGMQLVLGMQSFASTPRTSRLPTKTVLVVDDDESTRNLLARALGTRFRVRAVANAEEALEALVSDVVPDAMVLDVMMPDMDGFQLAEHVKQDPRLKRIPIVFLTARNDPKDVVRGIQVGARSFMMKPFSVVDVIDKIARATSHTKAA